MSTFVDSLSTALTLISTLDSGLTAIVGRSLLVSATACTLACGLGLVLGAWLGVARFAGRSALLTVLNTMLAVPSVVVGLVIYLLLSRSGPLGFLGWLFSFKAMVLAQTLLVLPVATALTRQAIEDADGLHGEQLQSLGASTLMRSLLLAWDERYALLTVMIASFGRAISEVGAVMIVGGNIDGFTRVMTTAIALETSKGDLPLALGLGMILLSVVLLLNMLITLLSRWRAAQEAGGGAATAFDLQGVAVQFGTQKRGVRALNGVDLRILPGERVALVGSNGCGKSTLLRVLHRLIVSHAGELKVHPTARQAMLFQRPHLLRLSVQANVALGLWLSGVNWALAKSRALLALERVGLTELAQRNARKLSGGQQQRVAMARAWVMEPQVLLLDEPTASLDPHAKREVEALIEAFAQQNTATTLVFASHNLGQVKRLASRVIYLEQGRLLADLPVQEFFSGSLLQTHYPQAHFFVKGESL